MQVFNVDFERRIHIAYADKAALQGIPPRIRPIIADACLSHGVAIHDVLSRARKRRVVACRNEIFYRLRRDDATRSWPRIGGWFGRDHTTALQGAAMHARNNGLPQIGELNLDAVIQRNRRNADARWKRIQQERAAA